jgi:oligoendopeptidase F
MKKNKEHCPQQPDVSISYKVKEIEQEKLATREETWNTEGLFLSWEEWDAAFDQLPDISEIKNTIKSKYKGKLTKSIKTYLQYQKYIEATLKQMENLNYYCAYKETENIKDSNCEKRIQQIYHYIDGVIEAMSFERSEIYNNKSAVKKWEDNKEISLYWPQIRFYMRTHSKLNDVGPVEAVDTIAEMFDSIGIWSQWHDFDLQNRSVSFFHKGTQHTYQFSDLRKIISSREDAELRRSAYFAAKQCIEIDLSVISKIYITHVKLRSKLAYIKSYPSSLAQKLEENDVSVCVYDNWAQAVSSFRDEYQKILALETRAKNLKILTPWDMKTPVMSTTPNVPWETAVQLIHDSVAPLGKEYQKEVLEGLTTKRWTLRGNTKNQQSGAFSLGGFCGDALILNNYDGTFRALFTQAHEIGHSMNHFLSKTTKKSFLDYDPEFTLAEIASILNELLLFEHIKSLPDYSKFATPYHVLDMTNNVFIQAMYADFENRISMISDQNKRLAQEDIENVWKQVSFHWVGRKVQGIEHTVHHWAKIPHFYYDFYLWLYSFSACVAVNVMKKLKKNPLYKEKVLAFLSAGSVDHPVETIEEILGIDVTNPNYINSAVVYLRARANEWRKQIKKNK